MLWLKKPGGGVFSSHSPAPSLYGRAGDAVQRGLPPVRDWNRSPGQCTTDTGDIQLHHVLGTTKVHP